MEEITYKKMNIKKIEDFSNLKKLLKPVKDYVEEKKNNGMYDDYDEYNNTMAWIENRKNFILEGKDILTAYYIENSNLDTVGIIFSVTGNATITKFIENHQLEVEKGNPCQLVCFHIDKNYRGIGKKFMEQYVFEDLKEKEISTVFIKSSHNKALSLYGKLGEKVGTYIGLSAHKLYQRYGYIYKINL